MSRNGLFRGVLIFLLAAVLGPLAWGWSDPRGAFVEGPIVLGNQLHAGGEITLERVGGGQLFSVRINGRPVALIFSNTGIQRDTTGKCRLCLARDERGYYYFAVRSRGGIEPEEASSRVLQLAVVGRGFTTVSPPWDSGEGVARRER